MDTQLSTFLQIEVCFIFVNVRKKKNIDKIVLKPPPLSCSLLVQLSSMCKCVEVSTTCLQSNKSGAICKSLIVIHTVRAAESSIACSSALLTVRWAHCAQLQAIKTPETNPREASGTQRMRLLSRLAEKKEKKMSCREQVKALVAVNLLLRLQLNTPSLNREIISYIFIKHAPTLWISLFF